MVVGFNHNFRYKGEVYHIQTEDSGVKSPNIVTLLYYGGTILASKKTSYADIAKVDNLSQVVEELMKEQHKNMLRSLKSGEFDAVLERFHSGGTAAPKISGNEPAGAPTPAAEPETEKAPPAAMAATPVVPAKAPLPEAKARPEVGPPPAAIKKPPSSTAGTSLDEVILSYLLGDDK